VFGRIVCCVQTDLHSADGELKGISKHVELFVSDRQILYIERLFGIGGFPFLLCVLAVFDSKAIATIRIAPTVVLSWFLKMNHECLCLVLRYHNVGYQYHLCPTPPVILELVFIQCTRYWMYQHPSTRCKYCFELYSLSYWVYLAPNLPCIYICNDAIEKWPQVMRFDICQYTH